VRRTKIAGTAYSLESCGLYSDIVGRAVSLNEDNGCFYYPIAHGSNDFDKCIAKVRRATETQIRSWPELAAYRGPEWVIQGGVYLLWIIPQTEDQVRAELDKKFEPRLKAIRDSERITEEDLKLVINVTT